MEVNQEGQRDARGPTAGSKRGHKTRKIHRCIYCSYASHFITNYRKHMSTHTGEKPYACSYCPYRSNARDHLFRHMQRHTGVKPFRCPFCPLSCSRRVDLNNHMFTHHAHSSMDQPLPDIVWDDHSGKITLEMLVWATYFWYISEFHRSECATKDSFFRFSITSLIVM